MFYQIGNQCLPSREAENVYFSLVEPVITQDGRLVQPEYNGQNWVLNGQTIKANLPECSPEQNFKDGYELGWLIFGVAAVLYLLTLTRRQIR